MSKSKVIGTDGIFLCEQNIKVEKVLCAGCGKTHYIRIEKLRNWLEKVEPIDKETYYTIIKEQSDTKVN